MKKLITFSLLAAFSTFFSIALSHAQDGTLDKSYVVNPSNVWPGSYWDIAIQSDGKAIYSGYIDSIGSTLRTGIGRVNTDGTLDTKFDPGPKGYYRATRSIIQSDGKIIVIGTFTSGNSTSGTNHIARLLPDGSPDPSYKVGAGFNGTTWGIDIQPDDKVIVTGGFSTYDGKAVGNIVRLNTDGSLDATFKTGSGFNSTIWCEPKIQPDGKILVGGQFTSFDGNACPNKIARLNSDGTFDKTFGTNAAAGALGGSFINSFALQSDGKIIVYGSFSSIEGHAASNIARLNPDGTFDPSFKGSIAGQVRSAKTQPDDKVLVGGYFAKGLVRLNADGTIDNTFVNGAGFNGGTPVEDVNIQADGNILVSGSFVSYDGATVVVAARLKNTIASPCTPTTSTLKDSACDKYEFNKKAYTSSGTYQDTLVNAAGCDSVVTLILTIHRSTGSSMKVTACDHYDYMGNTYTSSGTYKITIPNAAGCDSVITLTLVINKSTSSTLKATACNSYDFNGRICTASGTYLDTIANAAGCDSFITLNLTVNKSSSGTLTATACDSFEFNDKTYTASGTYHDTILNIAGCDSAITLKLTIHHSSTDTISETVCHGFILADSMYTKTGMYSHTFSDVHGCDSTVVLDLTVNKVDLSITQNGNHLTASPNASSYQWLDCNKGNVPIARATQQTYTSYIEGDFSVIVTLGNCSDTSVCYHVEALDIPEADWAGNVILYPNPGRDKITLRSGIPLKDAAVRIVNIVGQTVMERSKISGSSFSFDIHNYAAGVYYLQLQAAGGVMQIKFIKD